MNNVTLIDDVPSEKLEFIARPMSRDQLVLHLLRFHGHSNPEVLRAYLDEKML